MGNLTSVSKKKLFVETEANTHDAIHRSCDVIVVFIDTSWNSNDEIIKRLAELGGNIFSSEWDKLRLLPQAINCQVGDVFLAKSTGNLKWRHLLFAVWKERDSESSSDEEIKFVVENVLHRAINLDDDICTIAIPLGTTGMSPESHIGILNNVYLYQFQQTSTTHIHIITSNEDIKQYLSRPLQSFKEAYVRSVSQKDPNDSDVNEIKDDVADEPPVTIPPPPDDEPRCDSPSSMERYDNSDVPKKRKDLFPEKESIWIYYTGTHDEYESIKKKCTSIQSSCEDVALDYHNVRPPLIYEPADERFVCAICYTEKDLAHKKVLPKCFHEFCRECVEKLFPQRCPKCRMFFGIPLGNQPRDGIMSFRKVDQCLPGFPGTSTIIIQYDFPDGTQTEKHPNPGVKYKGLHRTAFLPDTKKGRQVHRMLKNAFDQLLIFTVGRSVTTGKENVMTWNDIHHKTKADGGPERYGYPDPEYLDRVLDQLHSAGVTDDCATCE